MLKALNPWVLLGVLALVAASYFLGRSHGFDSGVLAENKAHLDTKNRLTEELNEKIKQENIRRELLNSRIADLELNAKKAADAYARLERTKSTVRTEIVTQYKPVSPGTCAVSPEAARTVNRLMDVK